MSPRKALLISTSLCLGLLIFIRIWWYVEQQHYNQFDEAIERAAVRYDVDPALIRAVISRESDFDPDAWGAAKERGLMQVTPGAGLDWARAMGIKNFEPEQLYNPETNINAGTWYLSRARKRWADADDPNPFALAEYNAGPVNARRWAKELPSLDAELFTEAVTYPTTKAYIREVLRRYEIYQQQKHPDFLEALRSKITRLLSMFKEEEVRHSKSK